MTSNRKQGDLEWALTSINSNNFHLQNITIYLCQPTSGCYQETENSIIINISEEEDISYFSLFLAALQNTESSLQNIGFNNVSWELQQVGKLGELLDSSCNVKKLVFQRNKFTVQCLLEISDILKRNGVIKEIMFNESSIGSVGAGLLASALKLNSSLEELQIWEDSIGSKGAEELAKMIEANATLKLLTVYDSNSITATPLISAVLARNRSMEVHIWTRDQREKSSKVVEFLQASSTLRIYRLDFSGACRVACALGWNSTVTSLDMTGVRLKSRWAKEFRWVLEQNRSLKEVNLSRTCLKDEGIVYVAAGLFKNESLESLYLDGNWFGGIGVEHLLCPLSRFSSLNIQANITLKSVTIGGRRTKIGRNGLTAIIQLLTTNQTVIRLGIYDDESLRPEDIIKIFKSLETNSTLKFLSMRGCKGVDGELVLQTILEILQVNPWIEDVDLTNTPLHDSGKTESISMKLGQNGRSEPEFDSLKDMPMTVPKSCRVFLCGQDYAGKTTLQDSILQNLSSTKLPSIDQARIFVNPVEYAARRGGGIKIKDYKDKDTKISIWNLSGTHELYSIHDLMFPGHGSASLFVIVASLLRRPSKKEPKSPSEIEEELQYWLRFIVSNSRRVVQQCMLPNVTVVLTHIDKINHTENLQGAINAIQGLRDKFIAYVEIYPNVFTIDARSSGMVSKLSHHVQKTSKTVLERVPRVYEICNDLIQILSDWRSENYKKPVMKWKEFCDVCQTKVSFLRVRSRYDNKEKVEKRRRTIARCLHHIGEVIYFDELGFVILDCEWFCCEVLGQLVRLDPKKQNSAEHNGFLSREDLEKILEGSLRSQIPGMSSKIFENLNTSDLVSMMMKLKLCYEQDPSDPNSLLLIPSTLEEGRGRTPRWELSTPDCIYAGRHLECDDSSHMFLTPGFFPRLQVHLHNKMMRLNSQHGGTYTLEKNLISININGMYIRIELGGQLGYYIDVLLCSTKSLTETLRLFQQIIVPAIHSQCHGVTLTENVFRTECVKNLMPPRYRKAQVISLQQLKQALLSVPAESMYNYQHTWGSVSESGETILRAGFDLARDLLSDDEFRDVLERRYHDIYNLAVELQVPLENSLEGNASSSSISEQEDSNIDPTFVGIAKGVEEVLQRLKIIEQEIRDIKQEIQGLRYYEHKLLCELQLKVNYLVNYNVQLEERKVPNMFYFVRTDNYSRRLVTTMISGMNALRLHMLCEYRGEMHVVEEQIGCEMMQVDNSAVKCLAPYMNKFMKLLTFALKIGVHLAAGMGEMIPDLSKEVFRLVESPLLGAGAGAAAAAGIVGAAAISGSRRPNRSKGDIQQDLRLAQQWVIDFLRERKCFSGKQIADRFGLYRIRYRDDGLIAWVCARHIHTRANDIVQLPV